MFDMVHELRPKIITSDWCDWGFCCLYPTRSNNSRSHDGECFCVLFKFTVKYPFILPLISFLPCDNKAHFYGGMLLVFCQQTNGSWVFAEPQWAGSSEVMLLFDIIQRCRALHTFRAIYWNSILLLMYYLFIKNIYYCLFISSSYNSPMPSATIYISYLM